MTKGTDRVLNEEVLGNPPLSSKELRDLDEALTKILRESNQQSRDELESFLVRWRMRTLFVGVLQEEKDRNEAEKKKHP
jgi:hypothetical protein